MRERYPRFFDAMIWPAVICGDAVMLLIFTAAGFLALWGLDDRQTGGALQANLAYVGASYWLVYVPLSPLWARLGGRVGVRKVALAGAVGVLAATVLLTAVGNLWQLMAVMALLGAAASAMWPNIEAELSRGREGPMLRRRLAFFNVMWNCGLVLGPLLGLLVVPEEQAARGSDGRALVNVAFHTTSLLAVGLLVCLALWRTNVPDAGEVRLGLEREGGRDPVRLRAFWLMAFVANFSCYVVLGTLRHLYERLAWYHWPATAADRAHGLLTLLAISSVLTYIVLFFAHRWHYRLKRHLAWQAVLAGGLVLVALTNSVVWSAVGFVVIGAGTAFIYSGSLFYSMEGHDEASHMGGWHEAVLGSGSLAGLLVTGHIPELLHWRGVENDYWPVRSPYLAAAGLFLVGIIVQWTIYRTHARRFQGAKGTG